MRQGHLKTLRVVVSLAVLGLTTALFVDLHGAVPAALSNALVSLQPAPALIRTGEALGWATAGVGVVLVLTAAFGRVFCSFLCPLGTLQDIVIRLARGRGGAASQARFRATRPRNALRYGVLAATLATAMGGSMLLVTLLDPFSAFGRIASALLRPLAVGLNNLATHGLEAGDLYVLAPVKLGGPGWPAVVAALLTVGLVGVMAARRGRLFCNSLCPVGTVLGLVSRLALFRVAIDRARCNHCAGCSLACKAGCIHLKTYEVDASRCVACYDCIPACPEAGVRLQWSWAPARVAAPRAPDPPLRADPQAVSPRRRAILKDLAGMLVVAGVAGVGRARALPAAPSSDPCPDPRPRPAAPPGAGSVARLNRTCTACQLCVATCPTRVLQPAFLQFGLAGLLQPRLDYAAAYCDYECVRCGEVCPTGAIRALSATEKKRVQIGRVRFVEDLCIVVTEWTACGACAEHCPTRAVHMVPYEGELTLPKLDNDVCVGCGACEHACPVVPIRAIVVDGEPVHLTAAPPRETRPPVHAPQDFPF